MYVLNDAVAVFLRYLTTVLVTLDVLCVQSKEATKLAQRIALAEEQFDQGLRKLTAASKQLASLKRQVGGCRVT